MNQLTDRKHFVDNLRAFTVLFLFPLHISMIYNNWGEQFYVSGAGLLPSSLFVHISSVWMMPLLFAIAGISSRYALEKRNAHEYIKERFGKLLVPLAFGLLLVIPIQSYLAGLFHNGHANYFDFFTRVTDLYGSDGSFTPAHLWFILFLFIYSIVFLPVMLSYKNRVNQEFLGKTPILVLILLGLIPVFAHPLLDIGGKSLGEYASYFLLGFFFLANENVLVKLEKFRFLLLGLLVAGATLTLIFDHVFYEAVSWLSILAIIGLARRYLNFSNSVTGYLVKSSFGVYVFHQSWIVVTAFFILKITGNPVIQIPLIFLSSVALTFSTYEICRRVSIFCRIFGLKKAAVSFNIP